MPPEQQQNQEPQADLGQPPTPVSPSPTPGLIPQQTQATAGQPVTYATPIPPTEKKSKKMLLIFIVCLVLVAIIVVLAVLLLKKKTPQSSSTSTNQSTTQSAQKVDTNTPAPAASAQPTTADTLSTLCYSFTLPRPHEDIPGDNTCVTPLVYYGKDMVAGVNVISSVARATNLNDMVTDWKKTNTDTIVSETKAKLGAYDMDKIVTRSKGVVPSNSVTVLVYTSDKYKVQGYTVPGFEIRGRYEDDSYGSKTGMDSILASWQWK